MNKEIEYKDTYCTFCVPNDKDLLWQTFRGETNSEHCEGFNIVNDKLRCTLEAGCSCADLKINFCPMCGRRIEHKEIKL